MGYVWCEGQFLKDTGMTFPERQFARAMERIAASKSEKLQNDKRRADRIPIRVPVVIKLNLDPKTKWTGARLHDISAHGARVEIPSPMDVGDSFLLRLPSKDGKQTPQQILCRVIHCLKKNNSFVIGAEFLGQLVPHKSAPDDAAEASRIQHSILD